ncbi:MAG TPA: alpha/beta hydrolase [Polyangiaceae bacterium]|nr:alpha/beta hydrolase [Polyangiaceae bacterium]
MLRLLRILLVSLFTTIRARFRRGPARRSWGFQFEWVVAFLRRDFEESAHWPYEELRHDLNGRRYPAKATKRVTLQHEQLGGLAAIRFTPPSAKAGIVLFLHGGSYIFGSIETTHAEMAAGLALASDVTVIGIDYRLAPEHAYPAALEDALAAFDALVAGGIDPSRIAVAGDSAGGNLALALQIALRDRGTSQARAALLISPWLDLTASRASCHQADGIDYGQTWFLLRHARDFAGGLELSDPRVSLIDAELAGLSQMLVAVGGAERLFDEGKELVERARAAGVDASLYVAPEMPHNPPAFVDFHPTAAECMRECGRFIVRVLQA